MHPGGNKLYRDLREQYWWPGLKRKVTEYLSKCLTCQQVKAEHQLPSRLLQPVKIQLWKWERKLAKLYVAKIVRLHGVPVSIISNRDPRFISRFWKKLHEALGTRLDFSIAFHAQTDGHCRTPTYWTELGERRVLGPELISNIEDKVKLIRDWLKEASDRQKSYADLKRKEIEYSVGDYVFLKVSPWKEILRIHDVFHVSMLKRYRSDPSHIVSVEEIEVGPDLTIEEELVQILDRDVKVLRKKSVLLVKVLWHNHGSEEAMWEPEEAMRQQYPHLF
ncbi:uncharacterized protein LOC108472148 [Gossypium arboreum]|uniref:uncharacterized protein LOC108472148 n=1 Tax=Gossypium arboreum TaxID=29729 RepID=UPI0008196E31|nr:uncharacterized protein LOC108472148 [Gossypium arboreum]